LNNRNHFSVQDAQSTAVSRINDDEKEQFKEAAKYVLGLSQKQLAEFIEEGDFVEVKSV